MGKSFLTFPFPTEEITEGSVNLTIPRLSLFSRGKSEYIPSKAPVFYNPLMELNRDVTILAIRSYQKRVNHTLQICDPLTGCGVRGLRFASEVKDVDLVVLNDLNPQAVKLAQYNAEKNNLSEKIIVENTEARILMMNHSHHNRFDVIDIDPYGTPSPFLDSALSSLRKDGILALTATDAAPLCGVAPKACLRKYFGKPLRTEYCHELALRLIINAVTISAARVDIGISVLLSHSTDHYLRIFIELRYGAKKADESIGNLGYILHCFTCLNRKWVSGLSPSFDSRCDICGSEMDFAGPLWLGALNDRSFCRELFQDTEKLRLGSWKRLSRLLTTIQEEAEMPPTYIAIDKICEKLSLRTVPRDEVINGLTDRGYRAVKTHFNPQGIKSDASFSVIREVCSNL